MRIKRSDALIVFLEGDRIVFHNYLVQQSFSATPAALEIIRRLQAWTDPEVLVATLPGYSRQSILGSVDHLQEFGAIIVEDSAAADREEDFAGRWLWGPITAAYHFGARDGQVITAQDSEALLAQQVQFLPSPALYKTNSDPASDIVLPVRRDKSEPYSTMARRRTRRVLLDTAVPIETIAECLQFSMAITAIMEDPEIVDLPLKMTPSGGGRNPYEAYVCARNVTDLAPGVYHYSAFERTLGLVRAGPPPSFTAMLAGQDWAEPAAAILFLVANFERSMWKYHHPSAYRVTMIEAGHIAQNMMLVATEHGLTLNPSGVMAQDLVEETLGVGSVTQSAIYALVLGAPSAAVLP